MKRIAALLPLLTCCLFAVAQRNTPTVAPAPVHYNVSFVSQHGEAFSVFIDGELQNRLPQSRVLVSDVGDQTHEVVVVLKRPVEKCAVLQLRPRERNVVVNVNYDSRLEQVYLYTPLLNRPDAERYEDTERQLQEAAKAAEQQAEVPVADLRPVSEDELDSMVVRMRAQPFDSDRLALGKVIVASSHLLSRQIGVLAETIDYSNSQVDFLKYAYHYCADPASYYRAVDVLTFTADKKKVLDYIATQR